MDTVYEVFKDPLFIHYPNATIELNETEVPRRAHVMSRSDVSAKASPHMLISIPRYAWNRFYLSSE